MLLAVLIDMTLATLLYWPILRIECSVAYMLLQSMGMIYATHGTLESINMAIVCLIASTAAHAMTVSARSLYSSNLYLELV